MNEYEEEEFFDSEVEVVSLNEDDDEEDPKGTAFMRGVEEATEIRDTSEEE